MAIDERFNEIMRAAQETAAFRDEARRLRDEVRERTLSPMTDAISRAEIDAKLVAVEARGETQFEKLRGDIREMRGAMLSKTTFFVTMIAAVAVIISVLAYAGQWFGLGLQSHDVLIAAAKEGAAQAIAALKP